MEKAIVTSEEKSAELEAIRQRAMGILIGFYTALEESTGDGHIALSVIESITEGINEDPEFSKKILTPENIEKAYALKAKSEAGKVKLQDIENAFPALVKMIPFWDTLTMLLPKKFQ